MDRKQGTAASPRHRNKQQAKNWHRAHASLCFSSLSVKSVVTLTDPSEEDLGLYTVEISDNPNLSSSYDFTAEGKVKESSLQLLLQTLWQQNSSLHVSIVFKKKKKRTRAKRKYMDFFFNFKGYQAFLSSK